MSHLKSTVLLPVAQPLALATERYALRLARNDEEVRQAQRLRFNVFNLELNEGLADSFLTGVDEDEFDAQCDHLLVTEKLTGAVIGTYRLQTNEAAEDGNGFYAAGLFDLADLPAHVLANEIGRAHV